MLPSRSVTFASSFLRAAEAKAKSEHIGTLGLLQPLPIPAGAWEIVSLDFVEGLPKSSSMWL